MTETKTVFGIPLEGDPYRSRSDIKQRPKEELGQYIEAVLADDRVKYIVWRQYTPYFCDGDPCEFGVGDFGVILEGEDYSGAVGHFNYEEDELFNVYPDELTGWYGLDDADPLKQPLRELGKTSGEFEDAYYEFFGDHTKVIVSREKIVLEEYEHD